MKTMVDFYRFEHLERFSGCMHAVTMKDTSAPFSFSLALHTGEEREQIFANRKMIAESFGISQEWYFVVADQTHSDNIHIVTKKETRGWESHKSAIADCDALITDQKGVVLCVLTADCVPVLLYDPKKEVVAAVHAGWKGTKLKIVAKTVQKMQKLFGCSAENIVAGIAPAIGRCCYEVGEEVAQHFFDLREAFTTREDKYMLDLSFINKQQLLDSGLQKENIKISGICTACEVERYFSYRKEQGCSGRFMSMIALL